MLKISTQNYTINFNTQGYQEVNQILKENNYSKLFVLVDTYTHENCLSLFLSQIENTSEIEIIEIEAGEPNKTIDTCLGVWHTLSELNADRKSILINLGGGVVTDLGGFVACTYQRGIDFINVPTTLLAMVDASVGGKNGVDLGHLKNQVGVIKTPKMVLIDTTFLDTLSPKELRSGLAEMLKHGLINSEAHWNKLTHLENFTLNDLEQLIHESVSIKKEIVEKDPFEKKERKTLNFGHTLGHAIESHFLTSIDKTRLLHGDCVAVGMILACYISVKLLNFDQSTCDFIKTHLKKLYGNVHFSSEDIDAIIKLLKYDKKNEHGIINFVLLEHIAQPKINCAVENELIVEAFNYYK
tara:strand:+ start:676 stop:1740 length:1065 start_codon:yes stop_codon:yes gene_type:complete